MRWIDACHGLGGFRLGFEAAGAECVDAFDIKKKLVKQYRGRGWKTRQADIMLEQRLEPADLLVCGAPCQPFSFTNNYRESHSREDSRAAIPRRLFELAKEAAIPMVLLENVHGLLSARRGLVFAEILEVVSECGFLPQWAIVDCSRLGAPTKRTHLLLFAVSKGAGQVSRLSTGDNLPSVSCEEKNLSVFPYRLTSPAGERLGWGTQLVADFDEGGAVCFRSLGLKEAEAIQGLPQGWTDGLSYHAAWQALSDSFPPAAAFTFAKTLMEATS